MMKINSNLYHSLFLLFMMLVMPVSLPATQDLFQIEKNMEKLRESQRDLERMRSHIENDIQKAQSGEYMIMRLPWDNDIYFFVTKAEWERKMTDYLLLEDVPAVTVARITSLSQRDTRAFPAAAKKSLDKIEQRLENTNKELLALLAERDRQRAPGLTGPCDISGQWRGGDGSVFMFAQRGQDYSWSIISGGQENASGKIEGTAITVSWAGSAHGSGSASGTVACDARGTGTRINWSNGAVFTRFDAAKH